MVKVELRELVPMIADSDKASWRVGHHNGVAVIDNCERRRLVVKLDRWQVCLFCVPDVYGRLMVASLTLGERRIKRSPFVRAIIAVVRPMGMVFGRLRNDRCEAVERCRCYESNEHRFHRKFSLDQSLIKTTTEPSSETSQQ
jgi:hypothetical protein